MGRLHGLDDLDGLLGLSLGEVQEARKSLFVETTGVVGGQVACWPRVYVVGVTAALADHTVVWVLTVLRTREMNIN